MLLFIQGGGDSTGVRSRTRHRKRRAKKGKPFTKDAVELLKTIPRLASAKKTAAQA